MLLRSGLVLRTALLCWIFPLSAFGEAPLCHIGAYQLDGGSHVIISSAIGDKLRYRLTDGRSGELYPDGQSRFVSGAGWSEREPVTVRVQFGECAQGRIRLSMDGKNLRGTRVTHRVIPLEFTSRDGTPLYGELHLPQRNRPQAIVVSQFGSGPYSAVHVNYVQHLLPLHDIGAVVFDKRGTGRSKGKLTIEFDVLADDVVAAVEQIRDMPQTAGVPIGVMGESQGGWVVPLVATKAPVDFVIVSFGMAISPLEENRQEVMNDLRGEGFDDPAVLARAQEVVDVTNRIMISRFNEGLDELQALQERYGKEPWFEALGGDWTSVMAHASPARLQEIKPWLTIAGDITYDPLPTLCKVAVPSLWVLGAKDTEAPSDTTLAILSELQAQGKPIDIAVFPNADHQIIEVASGSSARTRKLQGRHSPGYFELLVDWTSKRALDTRYGSATLMPRRK
jgi:dienelactone hydrolase